MDKGSGTMDCIGIINSGMFFFFGICKATTHISFHIHLNFLQVLHIMNSLKITKTLIQS